MSLFSSRSRSDEIPMSCSALRRLGRERRERSKMGPEDEQLESRGADRVTTGVGVAIGN